MDRDNIVLRELTPEQREKAYKSYENQVEKAKKDGFYIKKLSRSEYLTLREGELVRAYESGYREKNVNRVIIEKQKYGVSIRQSKAFASAIKTNVVSKIEQQGEQIAAEKAAQKVFIDNDARERYIKKEKSKYVKERLKEDSVIIEGEFVNLKKLTSPKNIRAAGKEVIEQLADVLNLSEAYYQKKEEYIKQGFDIKTANKLARKFISREYFGSP